MPRLVHLIPLGSLILTLLAGPLRAGTPSFREMRAADRGVAAMQALASALGEAAGSPCAPETLELHERALRENAEVPSPGYRAFGSPVPFRLMARPGSQGPVTEVGESDSPGTIFVACDGTGARFWLSAVITASLPMGEPALVRDGVGKIAVLAGELHL
jgi:hypothetical protein